MVHNLFWLIKGVLIGFGISIPVGPLGVLCIQRTLKRGRIAGLITGLGSATADMIYAILAAFGLSYVAEFLTTHGHILRGVGGLFLIIFSMSILYSANKKQSKGNEKKQSLYALYSSAFLLTFTNPVTIFGFTAIFASLGVGDPHVDPWEGSQLVLGVFFGSLLWYFSLSTIVSLFHGRVSKYLPLINKLAGILLMTFGLIAVADGFGIIHLFS